MTVSKVLMEIEKELQQIIQSQEDRIEEMQIEIEKAKEDEEKAKEAVIEAKKGDDPKAYAKAVSDRRTATDIVSFYEGKIEELKNQPYITKAEYKEYTNRIKSEMDKINRQANKRVYELLDELESIRSELNSAYVKTNELLSNLQDNIFKYSAEKQMEEARKTGKSVNGSELRNEYKDDSVRSSINFILESHAAKVIKEKVNS